MYCRSWIDDDSRYDLKQRRQTKLLMKVMAWLFCFPFPSMLLETSTIKKDLWIIRDPEGSVCTLLEGN